MSTPEELTRRFGPLARLIGTWSGPGRGEYPTIPPFGYVEEVVFGDVGKPFLTYLQRTRAGDDGRPLHAETGYLRVPDPAGPVEWVIAHPTGIVELAVAEPVVDGSRLRLDFVPVALATTPTAKRVDGVWRTVVVDGDLLVYDLDLDAVGVGRHHHLRAELRRTG